MLSGVAGAKADAVEANAPRTSADTNFIVLFYLERRSDLNLKVMQRKVSFTLLDIGCVDGIASQKHALLFLPLLAS